MPIDVCIDTGRNLITRTGRDLVTVDECIQTVEYVLTHPDYQPGMKSLSDMRDVSHQLTADDVRRIAQVVAGTREEPLSTRAAIVVSKTVSYGLSRMLQIHLEGEGLPLALSVFYDMDEAERWLVAT